MNSKTLEMGKEMGIFMENIDKSDCHGCSSGET